MKARQAVGTLLAALALGSSQAYGAEKLRFASSIRVSPLFSLPIYAGEEKGFFKATGVDIETSFLSRGTEQAVAAGAVDMNLTTIFTHILATSRGLPLLLIADPQIIQPWMLWVRTDSSIRSPADLKGRKVAVTGLGRVDGALTLAVVKALDLEKDVRRIAVGGSPEKMAALQAGVVDAIVQSPFILAKLEYEGAIRKILAVADYLPREWMDLALLGTKDIIEKRPALAKKGVAAFLKATSFVSANPGWSIEKMKKEMGWPEPVAREIFKILQYSKDGKIYRVRIRNVRDFMIEFGLVAKEKIPSLESLYSDKFVPTG